MDLFVGIEDSTEHRFFETCLEDGAAVTTEQVVREAFEEIPIPASELVIQPPDGVTLVNLATLFRTDAEPFEETVTLLEQTVVLRIRPVGFTWHTGDGDWFTTTTPGLPYEKGRPMSDYVSHTYAEVHELVEPSVDVTWAAEYSVAGGSWFAVDGTVTITGPSAELQVKEAVPVLVGG